MIAERNKFNDGPRPTRGPSPWLLLAMAGLLAGLLTVGIRQMFNSNAKRIEPPKPEQILRATQPSSEMVSTIANLNHNHRTATVKSGNPMADHLAKRIQDFQVEDDPMQREEFIADLLAGLKTEGVAAALDVLKAAEPADLAADLSRQLIRRWAEGDPQGVAAWMNNLPSGNQREAALDNLAIVWANSQLADAIGWGQSLTDEGERHRALTAVANEAVRADPIAALQLAVNLPADSQRDDLIRRGAMEWASGDAPSAVAWAEQIPDETLRAKVLAGEAVAWAKQDPEAAAVLAAKELPAGRLQEDTVVSIVQRWAQQRPEAAAAWVAKFPEGPVRAAAIENLVVQWSQKDAAGAQQWLAAHS